MRRVVSYLTVCISVGVVAPLAFASAAEAGTTRVVHPGESIQAAVDASGPGDTVLVESGTYAQSVGIHTSGITLKGEGAKLVPPATTKGFDCVEHHVVGDGICIFAGNPGDPHAPILDGVKVQGMTVVGFPDTGIFAINETNLTYNRNTAIDNGGYGMAAFQTVGTQMLHNTATGAHEANFYLGDSPGANAIVRANVSHDAQGWGIFIRDSQFLTVQDNDIRGNCVGMLVLADNPGPAGNVVARHNTILANNAVCPGGEGPPLSGVGVALAGAHDVTLQENVISGNVAAGPTVFSGGVVLATIATTPPTNNVITKNSIVQNSTDIVSDGSDVGTVIKHNTCGNANPGLCA
jgi:hypothetical protein